MSRYRSWFFAFQSEMVLQPGAGLVITRTPADGMSFKGNKLIIPSLIAWNVVLVSLMVNNQEQLAGPEPIPGSMFNVLAIGNEIVLPPVRHNETIKLELRNVGREPLHGVNFPLPVIEEDRKYFAPAENIWAVLYGDSKEDEP